MSVSVVTGLLFTIMFATLLTPVFTFVAVGHTDKKRWFAVGFVGWLVLVYLWVILYLRLHTLKPEWYDAGVMDNVNNTGIVFGLISAVGFFGFAVFKGVF